MQNTILKKQLTAKYLSSFFTFSLMLLVGVSLASAQSYLSAELVLNSTDHTVYIPDMGESQSGSISPKVLLLSPSSYFVASYYSDFVSALASGDGQAISAETISDTHVIGLRQDLSEPVFLSFTKGNWQPIESRMEMIETGDFLKEVSPSFSYGLGTYNPLMAVLTYSGIDIDGSLSKTKGIYKLIIENMGQRGGLPVVSITGS